MNKVDSIDVKVFHWVVELILGGGAGSWKDDDVRRKHEIKAEGVSCNNMKNEWR